MAKIVLNSIFCNIKKPLISFHLRRDNTHQSRNVLESNENIDIHKNVQEQIQMKSWERSRLRV